MRDGEQGDKEFKFNVAILSLHLPECEEGTVSCNKIEMKCLEYFLMA
jgi:hypothetical protein